MQFNIVQPLVCEKGDKASPSIIFAGQVVLVINAHKSWRAWYIWSNAFKHCQIKKQHAHTNTKK